MPLAMSTDFEEAAVAESREKVEEPPLFKVLLHNDDYTTMEFVVWILESIFNMPVDQAIQVMLNVHTQGIGVAGIYTYEIAEMKVNKTTDLARENEFPLLCTMEKYVIAKSLQAAFEFAVAEAVKRRHEYVTLEHLLFALLHDREATMAVRACGGDSRC